MAIPFLARQLRKVSFHKQKYFVPENENIRMKLSDCLKIFEEKGIIWQQFQVKHTIYSIEPKISANKYSLTRTMTLYEQKCLHWYLGF